MWPVQPTSMPVPVGVRLGSAALQALADDAGADILHIKGPAASAFLAVFEEEANATEGAPFIPRPSVDVDLLVRPSHLRRLFAAMRAHGWEMAYRFEDGSAFEHASTWLRPGLAAADIHRRFPGIGAQEEAAFERFWRDRRQVRIAGYPCTVPSPAAQRLILILHAARGGELAGEDIERAWGAATFDQRAEIDSLATDLDASVALAAGTGRLDQHRASREYALWRALSTGEQSRLKLWCARVRAAPGLVNRVRTAVVLVAPKPGRLRHQLGREPRADEVAVAWVAHVSSAFRGATGLVQGLRRPRGPQA